MRVDHLVRVPMSALRAVYPVPIVQFTFCNLCLNIGVLLVMQTGKTVDDFNALRGVCVGQAANPGPSGSDAAVYEDVTLSVFNPTILYTHHDVIIEHPSDVQFLSETSTTIDAQKSVRSQMRGSGKRVVFGAPCTAVP